MALGTEYEKFILSWHFKMSWFSLRHTPGGITILQVPNGITVVPAGIGPKRLGLEYMNNPEIQEGQQHSRHLSRTWQRKEISVATEYGTELMRKDDSR